MGRRLNHEGSINKVKNRNSYLGQIWVTRNDGTRFRKKVYAKTRKEVQERLRQIRYEQKQGISPDIKSESVKEYLERWYKDPNLRPSSIDSRRVNIQRATPFIGGKDLKSLRAADIQFVYKILGKRLSASSVMQVHAMLRKALRDALKEGLIVSNPMNRVTHTPKIVRKEMNYLYQDEVTSLLSIESEWKPLWTLLIGTGLRIGESLGLQWKDIDESSQTLKITRTIKKVTGLGLIYQNPKTDKSRRIIFLPNTVSKALRRHRIIQSEYRLKLGDNWVNEDLVFPNEWGKPLDPARVNRALKKSITRVGIERHIRVHDLRHTAASLALLKGIPGKVVQEMLGHSHYSTTMDIYSHVDQSLHKEASQKMNAVLGGL